jgi:uracil phosphoribosyltransferase
MGTVHELNHPLIQHKLALLRDRERSTNGFRALVREIALLMAYELTRGMRTQEVDVQTPLEITRCRMVDGESTVLVPILRAGLGLVEGMLAGRPGRPGALPRCAPGRGRHHLRGRPLPERPRLHPARPR